jgi:hypothetical protein
MKSTTVRESRDRTATLLRSTEPVLVMRRGRLAGIFFPKPETSLPLGLKRELFSVLSAEVARQFLKQGLTEDSLVEDFETSRKQRREAHRRR